MLSTVSSHASPIGGKAPSPSPSYTASAPRGSLLNVNTSGQHDVEEHKLTPYSELPKEIPASGPTVWRKEDYEGEANRHKWVHIWSQEEVELLEEAGKKWQQSGRPLQEIEKDTFPLPAALATTIRTLRDRILNGHGFYLFKGLPVQKWDIALTAAIYLGIGAHLGNAVSQNRYGHILGHVKDLGADPTQIDKVRIYRTSARQFFHVDSSGSLIGLLCLQTALEGGESDIASSHAIWNELQRTRPDVAELLSKPIWYFDRKGEVSKGQKEWYKKAIFSLVKGQPAERLILHIDPYYLKSTGRFVEKGLIPGLSEEQKEAIEVLEQTAQKLALHMELEVGDMQIVSDTHVVHARTAYTDHPAPHPKRHLLRLWLSVPESDGGWVVPYPDSAHPRRGGIVVDGQSHTCPLDAE